MWFFQSFVAPRAEHGIEENSPVDFVTLPREIAVFVGRESGGRRRSGSSFELQAEQPEPLRLAVAVCGSSFKLGLERRWLGGRRATLPNPMKAACLYFYWAADIVRGTGRTRVRLR